MARYGDADEAVATLAANQHGAVARWQALEEGLSPKALRVRVQAGRLRYVHGARVYLVQGWPETTERTVAAAVLACGAAAFASHSTAATLHAMAAPPQARVEVTVPLGRFLVVDGVRLHRSGLLVERDVTTVAGIAVATPERTIVDLSGRLPDRQLQRLADDAVSRRITNIARLASCAGRLPSAPGRSAKKMRAVIDALVRAGGVRESHLEDFVYESIGRFGLPLPVCQHPEVFNGRDCRIDQCYPESRIALEADGFDAHRGRAQFDNDRIRGNDITLAGYTLLRFTSAFTDWRIASTVATALGLAVPPKPEHELTFAEWSRVCSEQAP
jgi:hypothetical protein